MGLLYEKYASPNELINRMLKAKKFPEFVNNLVKKHNEEAEHKKLWELYLHHPFLEKSYEEWKKECVVNRVMQVQRPAMIQKAVKTSYEILQDFVPEE